MEHMTRRRRTNINTMADARRVKAIKQDILYPLVDPSGNTTIKE